MLPRRLALVSGLAGDTVRPRQHRRQSRVCARRTSRRGQILHHGPVDVAAHILTFSGFRPGRRAEDLRPIGSCTCTMHTLPSRRSHFADAPAAIPEDPSPGGQTNSSVFSRRRISYRSKFAAAAPASGCIFHGDLHRCGQFRTPFPLSRFFRQRHPPVCSATEPPPLFCHAVIAYFAQPGDVQFVAEYGEPPAPGLLSREAVAALAISGM